MDTNHSKGKRIAITKSIERIPSGHVGMHMD